MLLFVVPFSFTYGIIYPFSTEYPLSELRFAGWVSNFFYISVICYMSRDKTFGLLPRQKEHTDDQLGHIYSIMLNQIMVTSLFSFPVIN
jgi:hypothetical protein